ncbi:hypothetical protein JZ751_009947 [Albula glossodonta]|uniref:EF-hand domain-containing protein n=1 Tax=Albula glossodonta TaxID=121402 RepID=A0A8T2P113_9TELE|nr:hypothetical protein JZ751_009947 [Albula glossodonta]
MSRLEQTVVSLVELFEEYAGQDEQKNKLSSAELKQLLEKELSSPEFKVSDRATTMTVGSLSGVWLGMWGRGSQCILGGLEGRGKKFNEEDVGEAMKTLDKNHDGAVNMREFCQLVGLLAKGYYRQKKGKGGKDDQE